MQIIGILGRQGSGKTAVTEFLKKQGYQVLEMNTAAVEEAKRLGIEITKSNLPDIGTRLRKERGSDYAAKYLCEIIKEKNPFHIS